MLVAAQSVLFLALSTWTIVVSGFVLTPTDVVRPAAITRFMSSSDAATTANNNNILSLSLEKPLGLILEEVEEGQPKGVYVLRMGDDGSALAYQDQLQGLRLSTVQGVDVTSLDFDTVMEKLIAAPSPVALEFSQLSDNKEDTPTQFASDYEIGTTVTIKILEDGDGKESVIEAKVGDNMRKTLLENNIQVYKGLKQLLGNCGGAGQCTFCAAEFVDSKGWLERSDYEDHKLKNKPNSRLTCLNNIQGPATIRI